MGLFLGAWTPEFIDKNVLFSGNQTKNKTECAHPGGGRGCGGERKTLCPQRPCDTCVAGGGSGTECYRGTWHLASTGAHTAGKGWGLTGRHRAVVPLPGGRCGVLSPQRARALSVPALRDLCWEPGSCALVPSVELWPWKVGQLAADPRVNESRARRSTGLIPRLR